MTLAEKIQANWRIAVAAAVPLAALAFMALNGSSVVAISAIVLTIAAVVVLLATVGEDSTDNESDGRNEYTDAIDRTMAVIEFSPDGTILECNALFQHAMGYQAEELVGKHHRIFAQNDFSSSPDYTAFWEQLRRGEHFEGECERLRKNGEVIWLQATYHPIKDETGTVVRVVKYAQDITKQKTDSLNNAGLLTAIDQSMATIEFSPEGVILTANQHFVDAAGYQLDEIVGQHHRIFMPKGVANTPDYQDFWRELNNGRSFSGEFQRITKSGDDLWLHASYSPVLDGRGNVVKVVKVAQDITTEKTRATEHEGKIEAIRRSQAVIEFEISGEIVDANDIALDELGYGGSTLNGRSFRSLISERGTSDSETNRIWERVVRGEPVYGEYCLVSRDNQDVWFRGTLHPIKDSSGRISKVVQFMDNVTETKKDEDTNQLLRGSLERLTTVGIMVADENYNVTYMNNTIADLFREHEAEMRKDIAGFRVDDLLGANIDIFHRDPSHQRRMLDAMTNRHVADLDIGGLSLRLEVNPTFDAKGNRTGTVVEWLDRTAEVAVERAIQNVVDAAVAGDLSKRVDEDIANGFLEWLPGAINEMVSTSERAIDETVAVLSGLARGDLTREVEGEYRGSFAQLKSDVNSTVGRLTEVVTNIQTTSKLVKTGVSEISQGNVNLSQRTEQQASSLEETASSMEQLTSTVKQNAGNAEQANTLAVEARDAAERGGAVVKDAVNAMAEISDSSSKISDIIRVIDEIAFQTNLLALNASVEAARAGEQGRGFAVVAREVRDLAGRSATAAKQIKDLIEDSGQRVVHGSKLVNESGETLDELVLGIKRVTDIVSEITVASQEQAVGIEEVNRAVIQLDQLTQQNAALVEEAAAASESMGEQADELDVQMRFFQVSGSGYAPVAAKAQAGPPGGVERRSGERPWSGGGGAAAPSPAAGAEPASPMLPTGTGDEWEDF